MAAGDGLISMKPTSIAHSGTSASINSDGGVDFTAVTSLSLNGVFTGSYDNYLISYTFRSSIDNEVGYFRYRISGTDDSTANSYTTQSLGADGTTVSAARSSSSLAAHSNMGTEDGGAVLHIYGPFLTQPTAARCVSVNGGLAGFYNTDRVYTHNQSTSYDGFTLTIGSGNFTGTVHVFGYEE